jgi:hypothetical protein
LEEPDSDGVIEYSFCREEKLSDWVKRFAEIDQLGESVDKGDAKILRELHKEALFELLRGRIENRVGYPVELKRDAKGFPSNVMIEREVTFHVVRDLTQRYRLVEVRASGEDHETSDMVDQSSNLHVELSGKCPLDPVAVNRLTERPFVFRFYVVENEKVTREYVEIDPVPRGGSRYATGVELRDHLGKTLEFRVEYHVDGVEKILLKRRFAVHNFGLITTFPVVSEVAAVAKDWSAFDAETMSSLPLSYAVGIGDVPNGVAATFPATIGLNTRGAPSLSDLVKFYAHVSVISPTDAGDGAKLRTGTGVGFLFFDALSFSLAVTIGEDHGGQTYFMPGLSIPDIVELSN